MRKGSLWQDEIVCVFVINSEQVWSSLQIICVRSLPIVTTEVSSHACAASEDRKISRASSHTSGIESDSKVKMGDLEAEEEEQQGVTGSIDNHHEEEEVVVAPMKHTVAPPAPGSLLRSESTEDIINRELTLWLTFTRACVWLGLSLAMKFYI